MNLPRLDDEEENMKIKICWLAATSTENSFKKKFRRREIDGWDIVSIGHTVEKLLEEKSMSPMVLFAVSSRLSNGLIKLLKHQMKHLLEVTEELYKTHIELRLTKSKPVDKKKSEGKAKKTNDGVEDTLSVIEIIDLDDIPEVETVFRDLDNIKDVHLMEEAPNYPFTQGDDAHFGPLIGKSLDEVLEDFVQHEQLRDFEENVAEIQKSLPLNKTPSKRNATHDEHLDTPSKRSRTSKYTVDEDSGKSAPIQNSQDEDLGVVPLPEDNDEILGGQDGGQIKSPEIGKQNKMIDDADFILEALDETYINSQKSKKKKNQNKKNMNTNSLIKISLNNIYVQTLPMDERKIHPKSILSRPDWMLTIPCSAWAGANKYKKWNLKLTDMFYMMTIQNPKSMTNTTNMEGQRRDRINEKTFGLSDKLVYSQPSIENQNLIENTPGPLIQPDIHPPAPREINISQTSEVEIPLDIGHSDTQSLLTTYFTQSENDDPVDVTNMPRNESPNEWTKAYVYKTLQNFWTNNIRPIKFSNFAPKQSTSKQNRALSFKYLLELADEKILHMEQVESWAPIEIWFDDDQ